MAHDDYQFPTPAYSPLGCLWLCVGLVYALLVRGGAVVYALLGRKS